MVSQRDMEKKDSQDDVLEKHKDNYAKIMF